MSAPAAELIRCMHATPRSARGLESLLGPLHSLRAALVRERAREALLELAASMLDWARLAADAVEARASLEVADLLAFDLGHREGPARLYERALMLTPADLSIPIRACAALERTELDHRVAWLLVAQARALDEAPYADAATRCEAWTRVAAFRATRHELEGAIFAYDRAVELAPSVDNVHALATLLEQRATGDDLRDAADLYVTLAELSESAERVMYLERALALCPSHPAAQEALGALAAPELRVTTHGAQSGSSVIEVPLDLPQASTLGAVDELGPMPWAHGPSRVTSARTPTSSASDTGRSASRILLAPASSAVLRFADAEERSPVRRADASETTLELPVQRSWRIVTRLAWAAAFCLLLAAAGGLGAVLAPDVVHRVSAHVSPRRALTLLRARLSLGSSEVIASAHAARAQVVSQSSAPEIEPSPVMAAESSAALEAAASTDPAPVVEALQAAEAPGLLAEARVDSEPAKPAIEVTAKVKRVRGGRLNPQALKRAMTATLERAEACYAEIDATLTKPRGSISFMWLVNAAGDVGWVRTQRDSLRDRATTACTTRALKRAHFPRPSGGAARVEGVLLLRASS